MLNRDVVLNLPTIIEKNLYDFWIKTTVLNKGIYYKKCLLSY